MLAQAQIDTARTFPIENEIRARGIHLKRVAASELAGPCPICGGTDRFSINTMKQVFNCRHCQAGGDVIALVQHVDGCSFEDAVTRLAGEHRNGALCSMEPQHTARQISDIGPIVATYDYTDKAGRLLFQVVRYEPKTFRQRRPDGRGGWIWNTDGVDPVLYRLPDLIDALDREEQVWIVEGEKDADRLWSLGFPATTNPRGAGGWREEYNQHFAGADVVVVGDNDAAGQKHAQMAADGLASVAAKVTLVELSKVWPKCPPKGDISDYLDDGHNISSLLEWKSALGSFDFGLCNKPVSPREWLYSNMFCRKFGSSLNPLPPNISQMLLNPFWHSAITA